MTNRSCKAPTDRARAKLVGALVALASCTRAHRNAEQHESELADARELESATARDASEDVADARIELAPLAGDWIERVTLPSGVIAFITKPQGATQARPVVIAIHGAQDRADWACSEWRATVAGFAWVVCPQGAPLGEGFAWNSPEMIAKEAFEALAFVHMHYGAYVADGPLLYGGFSQGAALAASVVASHPGVFDPVILVEAGHTPLSASGVIYSLGKGKVTRAIVSCSTRGCRRFSEQLVHAAASVGFELLTNDAGLRGHVFDGEVMQSLGRTIARALQNDARYEGFAAAIEAR